LGALDPGLCQKWRKFWTLTTVLLRFPISNFIGHRQGPMNMLGTPVERPRFIGGNFDGRLNFRN
jgi:hypothetical protein